ncbi:MAG: CsbD family protein [Acidimicrobiia bacterium]
MDGTTDDIKGRAKEAVGDLTDDRDLKREGKADRVGAKAKDALDDLGDEAKEMIDDVKDKFRKD